MKFETVKYEVDVERRVAWITLNRPGAGNGITPQLTRDLAAAVEEANVDLKVHVIAVQGAGKIFCGGYDLKVSAEGIGDGQHMEHTKRHDNAIAGLTQAINHAPNSAWDPTLDHAMMSRNVKGFMSLFHSEKPTVLKLHGSCVAGGTDLAMCADFLICEDSEKFKMGYPPSRVWGVPTTALWVERLGAQKAKRLLLTGDCLSGKVSVCYEPEPETETEPEPEPEPEP